MLITKIIGLPKQPKSIISKVKPANLRHAMDSVVCKVEKNFTKNDSKVKAFMDSHSSPEWCIGL